jgi:adenylosuccinate lyase
MKEYVHFLCTSEDINNLSYSLMLTDAKNSVICTELHKIIDRLATFSE